MAVQRINISELQQLRASVPILDVRSPAEFAHAHIPGAYPFPLFTDAERKVVGTAYKKESREDAIKIGLDYFAPKMRAMIEHIERDLPGHKAFVVHCWRGGMRSAGVAWLLDLYGFKIYTLNGGYKAYRQHIHQLFGEPWPLKILGGFTGAGKTEILKQLSDAGLQTIDLEALAAHKGSAFGDLGMPTQPSQEMFENLLGDSLEELDPEKEIWIEDESRRIGLINLPPPFWQTMQEAPVHFFHIPFEERLQRIIQWYGAQDPTLLINAIHRIEKRLGRQQAKTAIDHLQHQDNHAAFRILLSYYDKHYQKSIDARKHTQITRIDCQTGDTKELAALLIHRKPQTI